ncbi:MAG TPA: glutaminase A [Vicinamibacterales bacterium]|jgi:glutaminase|nr:glutaminase A [Vicinamibacterales bacterium]
MADVAAPAHELQVLIDALHTKYAPNDSGQIATYIPELAKANPTHFGICLITTDGRVFEAGDCDTPFTIQSISKPFAFGLAVEEMGADEVLRRVSVEPSGDAFNSIQLQTESNRPFNPMINSGAITVSALLHARHGAGTFDHLLERFSAIAGRQLTIDEAVYQSERRTGHRNRAIAHLLLNFGVVHEEIEAALDVYFRQCSILVTARDLAMMSGTLANMGRNPMTGDSAFSIRHVKDILSIMFTCGMYDYSGQWAYRVGVPAKSGVSGGVIAVVNRQLGIGTYSPRLDPYGNSVRGIEVCVDLASRLGLHVFDCLNMGSSFLDAVLNPPS